MTSQEERIRTLVDLARAFRGSSKPYLITLLVSEAYGRECLERVAFSDASLDAAARSVDVRLRAMIGKPRAPIAEVIKVTERKRRAR